MVSSTENDERDDERTVVPAAIAERDLSPDESAVEGIGANPQAWRIRDALVVSAAFLAAFAVIDIGGRWLLGSTAGASIRLVASMIVPSIVVIVVAVAIAPGRGGGLWDSLGLGFKAGDIWLGLLVAIAAFAAAVVVLVLQELLTGLSDLPKTISAPPLSVRLATYVLALDAITLGALSEELLFRGIWWAALARQFRREWVVSGAVAFLFAAVHLDLRLMPVYFVYGLALGYARIRTGRITASIVAHSLLNVPAAIVWVVSVS